MNSRKPSPEKRNLYENEFSEFLLKKIGNAGGSIHLQHIVCHMSQLRKEIRNTVGTSMLDLKQFLRNHPNLFCLDNSTVSLASSSTFTTTSGYDSDDSSIEPQSSLPPLIKRGKGVIVKLFPSYGFIKSKDPIKTEVYFKAEHCGDPKFDLTSFLYIGANVFFNARRNIKFGCNYSATEVQKADNSTPQENEIKPKPRKNRETGLYDPLTLNGEGIIQRVFPNLGFIAVNGDDSNTVFFYKSRIANYDNIVDLTKILSEGDTVEFNAHRSTKSDARARWEATKVWKKSSKVKQNASISNRSQCNDDLLSKQSVSVSNKTKEMIKDQPGKICPRSHGAVIKFGKNELADGDSALYFVCGSQVTEISWEFSEGDDVKFDAVKIKSAPGWKALLVWMGVKPNIVLPTCLGDFSEFTDEDGEISTSVYTSKSSSSLSINSASSVKSASVTSESISSKRRKSQNFVKEKTPKLSTNKKVRDCKNSENPPPQNNFSSFSNNCQDLRKADESYSLNKFDAKVSNWGDSPYPDDNPEYIDSFTCDVSVSSPIEDIYPKVIEVPDIENESQYAISVQEKLAEEMNDLEFLNSNIKNDTDDLKKNNLKEAACIKKFQNIEGKISKIYSKFAEVKSDNLQKTLSFYWNNFYTNGCSMEEQELYDLKNILKVGDIIHFNYFLIIDDSGQSWQKVSLAWNGCKPKVSFEMSPKDFIKQNNLFVTIKENDISQIQEDKIPTRRFLTSFVDVVPDQGDKVSKKESYTEDDKSPISVPDSKTKLEIDLLDDVEKLSSTVCEILKKDIFSTNSKVDLYSVSEEIVNIVLRRCNEMKSNSNSCIVSLDENSIDGFSNICSNCRKKPRSNLPSQDLIRKDCDVQTIITGEIIAQNIFTEC